MRHQIQRDHAKVMLSFEKALHALRSQITDTARNIGLLEGHSGGL